MFELPFKLETLPAAHAEAALKRLKRERRNSVPILLGDADIFSAEWAEQVDEFEPPARVLQEARKLDADAWFAKAPGRGQATREAASPVAHTLFRAGMLPIDIVALPLRLAMALLTWRAPVVLTPSPFLGQTQGGRRDPIEVLRAQLVELEKSGTGTPDELREFGAAIEALEHEENKAFFPDPVAYVTPMHGAKIAAGLVEVDEPWQAAAFLQHGTYAICAPKHVLVAHCKWLWQKHGGRIITASTDHIGFEMEHPILKQSHAREVLRRFVALGATEVNAEARDGDGSSLIGAERLWVWWD